ncbi:hypothetical protein LPB90_20185 [Chryseobacterium sp. LC2016-29]|uniref:hypothetical protein n=2 Tax=unclassified Chryseobacterium TaxID=2593645 RepID=UPI001E41D952|nr:hypothetical protein [Chryseobacterium sp. LC2016-29]MCD0480769.1 hypothetical protein [Chryseobacterium sp. LC2016-29]
MAVIDGTNPVAKAKYVCTTRTIAVGCPAGMQDCEPITSTQMVCEFRDDTGGGIPPMGLNPCGDPFGGGCGGGGSGDGGYEYPEPPQESPCEKANALIDPTKANIKPLITGGMYDYIDNSSSGEAGVWLKKDAARNITLEIAPPTATNNIKIMTGGSYYSAIHTHPKDTYPMFTWADIYVLYGLEMNAATYNNGQSSFILVCEDDNGVKQTYMIMFEDIGAYMEDIFNNPDNIGCTHQEIIERMDTKLKLMNDEELAKDTPNYESAFLQLNFGTNIGLYKANSNLTGFSKLEIASNTPNAVVISTNCN